MPSGSRHQPGRIKRHLVNRKVLVVTPNFNEARDAQQALEYAGAQVVGPFCDASEALRSVAAQRLSCAVIDLDMANEQPIRIASALQDIGTPVIFLHGAVDASIPSHLERVPRIRKTSDLRVLLNVAAAVTATGRVTDSEVYGASAATELL